MRTGWVVLAAFVACGIGGSPVGAASPKGLGPLGFLLGDWQADGGGKPGEASGGFTFAPSLQERVILRTNYAQYPAASGKPASRHGDLMVLYATELGELRADYYDSEGQVIRYVGSMPKAGELILASEISSGAPRFRLTYKLGADGVLDGQFEVAPPGKPDSFSPYLAWTSRRKATGQVALHLGRVQAARVGQAGALPGPDGPVWRCDGPGVTGSTMTCSQKGAR